MRKSSGLGGSVVSNNILKGVGKLKWCIKEAPADGLDNGWRFLSDSDTEEFLADVSNMSICDWGTVVEIEPAIMSIFDMPVGTDITLIRENNKMYFVHTDSGEEVIL
ncbi:DUF2185 domain-containing protein [Salipaludibacillus agaradhaerens]|uniref:DUF2185 domain-containing protein n=1 Tax=Salipaludibacillus agaradhaerens TaxID=76935 RepID=UPI002151890F|nr:DUF2185 domain-containing protein [Salipaludibacillus agaradhaerens]MCR6108675.1 DUF2185 domain-containing protein [Salipaludibacillus agaradhaerens]MCR6120699.1 DUF2185 domain-containing protein [Salipaludibacillus agaradhaerens]